MKIMNRWRAIAVVAVAGMLAVGCQREADTPTSSDPVAGIERGQAQTGQVLTQGARVSVLATEKLPFHSEVVWHAEQVPVPEGSCTKPVPEGLTVLWLSKIAGTANTTHLGTGPYYVELSRVYGQLTNPGAPPPGNGIPMGWYPDVQIWTAANGDRLMGTGELVGFTAPPGTPGFKFIESLRFLDGGTGRFEYAEGEGTGLVDVVAGTAIYDGWIRYGK